MSRRQYIAVVLRVHISLELLSRLEYPWLIYMIAGYRLGGLPFLGLRLSLHGNLTSRKEEEHLTQIQESIQS